MNQQQASTTWTFTYRDCTDCGPRLHYIFTAGPRMGEEQCRECFHVTVPT